ncbi:MAG TPA: BlaI/MecI/CopY family transcriptional regulator [Armatimonadota bacterium]|nr:BlaI/MecI/CopY family transcriptional regulator [Armatimonadota bacterium]
MTRQRSTHIVGFGELQLTVLDALREVGKGTVYDVLDALPEDGRPRYNTVMTVLRTLEEKGLAKHTNRGRAFVYEPTPEAGHVRGQVLRDVLQRVFGGSTTRMMETLLREGDVSPEALDEIRAVLEREDADNAE